MDVVNSINSKFYSPDTALNSNLLDPGYVFNHISSYLQSVYPSINFVQIGHIINVVFFVCAVFFIFIISYSSLRILEIRKKEHAHLHHEIEEYAHHHAEKEKKAAEKSGTVQASRWAGVQEHILSDVQGNWKIAIIDADSMLEDLLDQLGFKGENLGEKLKGIDMEKYASLKDAWEAHLFRNQIAHEGIQFEVSQPEAKRIIAIYEQIFRDFRYI